MKEILLVGLGGSVGSISRYLISVLCQQNTNLKFPIATFIVNLFGCFLIGILSVWISKLTTNQQELRVFLIVGLLGGFTTFSAFGLETINLLKEDLYLTALIYVFGSLLVGISATYLGMKLLN